MTIPKIFQAIDKKVTPPSGMVMGKRILIVDDQESIVQLIQEILENLGFELSSAADGAEGMARLQEDIFHGVLLDLDMPVMDGLSMVSRLRTQHHGIPVIVMSGDPTRSAMIKAIESGANDYLLKPVSPEILKFKCLRLFI
ncbi:MAG: response regulator [Nitrospirales bacterium]